MKAENKLFQELEEKRNRNSEWLRAQYQSYDFDTQVLPRDPVLKASLKVQMAHNTQRSSMQTDIVNSHLQPLESYKTSVSAERFDESVRSPPIKNRYGDDSIVSNANNDKPDPLSVTSSRD